MSVVLHAKRRGTTNLPWLADIIARKPTKVAAVALANKTARIVWALLRHGGTYQNRDVPVIQEGQGLAGRFRSSGFWAWGADGARKLFRIVLMSSATTAWVGDFNLGYYCVCRELRIIF